jgi:hypothetical protein
MLILIEHMIGKRNFFHRWSMTEIHLSNDNNPWFLAMYRLVHGQTMNDHDKVMFDTWMMDLPNNEMADTGWGSCPNEVLKGLANFTRKLIDET